MANEGSSTSERTVGFLMRLLISLVLPAWGVAMIVLGVMRANGWWVASGVAVLAVGVVFFAGSSLISPFLGGRRFS